VDRCAIEVEGAELITDIRHDAGIANNIGNQVGLQLWGQFLSLNPLEKGQLELSFKTFQIIAVAHQLREVPWAGVETYPNHTHP
jgi:hypothetical protein